MYYIATFSCCQPLFIAIRNFALYYFCGWCLMFSSNLRAAREKSGLSQREVAEKLFVSAQAVGKWERGESTPTPEAIAEMALLFDTTADALLDVDTKKSLAGASSEAKREMIELVDQLSDEQVSKLLQIAKAALAL